jgi:diguanylate cyclase (GGDEF)-like protein
MARECQNDAERGGHRLQWGFITAIVAAALSGIGQFAPAAAALQQVREVAEQLGERDLLCDALLKQAEVQERLGANSSTPALLAQALALASQIGIRQFEMRAHQLYAQSLAAQGDFAAAFHHRSEQLVLANALKEQNMARKVQVLAVEMSVDQHRRRADEEKQRNAELAALNERLTQTLARAEHYASHDSLTELLNRREFLALTEDALARAALEHEVLGLAFVDLDGFKQINDTLGHDIGDELLVEVARRLKRAVRSCDLVSRVGGDEFMVLLRQLAMPAEIEAAVARLAAVFNEPFLLQGVLRPAQGSVGYALYPRDGQAVTPLRIAADRAMYAEKRRRRGDSRRA